MPAIRYTFISPIVELEEVGDHWPLWDFHFEWINKARSSPNGPVSAKTQRHGPLVSLETSLFCSPVHGTLKFCLPALPNRPLARIWIHTRESCFSPVRYIPAMAFKSARHARKQVIPLPSSSQLTHSACFSDPDSLVQVPVPPIKAAPLSFAPTNQAL
jgi:hypothetical protein